LEEIPRKQDVKCGGRYINRTFIASLISQERGCDIYAYYLLKNEHCVNILAGHPKSSLGRLRYRSP
jgi:hypothetical protein